MARSRCCTLLLYGIEKATSRHGEWPVAWVGVAGFETAASSSRSQVQVRAASVAAHLACDRLSVDVRWRPPLSVAIVTQFVTRSLASRSLSEVSKFLPFGKSNPSFDPVDGVNQLCALRVFLS